MIDRSTKSFDKIVRQNRSTKSFDKIVRQNRSTKSFDKIVRQIENKFIFKISIYFYPYIFRNIILTLSHSKIIVLIWIVLR